MKLYQFFDQDSPEYVILHAQSRAKRGKRPSVSFRGISNPREALKTAKATLFRNGTWTMLSPRVKALTGSIIMRITEALGLRLLTLDEFIQLMETAEPINSDFRVPLIEWDQNEVKLNWFGSRKEETWGARSHRFVLPSLA